MEENARGEENSEIFFGVYSFRSLRRASWLCHEQSQWKMTYCGVEPLRSFLCDKKIQLAIKLHQPISLTTGMFSEIHLSIH